MYSCLCDSTSLCNLITQCVVFFLSLGYIISSQSAKVMDPYILEVYYSRKQCSMLHFSTTSTCFVQVAVDTRHSVQASALTVETYTSPLYPQRASNS